MFSSTVSPAIKTQVNNRALYLQNSNKQQHASQVQCKAFFGTALQLSQKNKGLLAMDEADFKLDIRLEQNGVKGNQENRGKYREMLVSTEGLSKYISGAILTEETVQLKTSKNKTVVETLTENDINVGVKVDTGLAPIHGSNYEFWAPGLDNLDQRCKKLKDQGVNFLKYRSPVYINKGPSPIAIREIGQQQAKYAKVAQSYGLTPVVEPEVIMDGNHGVEKCLEVSKDVWTEIFYYLRQYRVSLEGILMKASMVTPGSDSVEIATPEMVAEYTQKFQKGVVPLDIPSIFYMTGGLTDDNATAYLNKITQIENPWNISYSFNRALTDETLKAWGESKLNDGLAQDVLIKRAIKNTQAVQGKLDNKESKVEGKSQLIPV